jgi:hypothetical protein
MTSSSRRATRRRRRLTWEVLSVFFISLVHLCSFSPLVHAELIRQHFVPQDISETAHCASPPRAAKSEAPHPHSPSSTSEPVCCSLMGTQKGRVVSLVQAEFFSVLWLVHRSFNAESFAWRASHNGAIPTRTPTHYHLSLYLLLSLLLI